MPATRFANPGRKVAANGLDCYQLKRNDVYAAVIDRYLVVADKPGALERIEAVHKAETPSVAGVAIFCGFLFGADSDALVSSGSPPPVDGSGGNCAFSRGPKGISVFVPSGASGKGTCSGVPPC